MLLLIQEIIKMYNTDKSLMLKRANNQFNKFIDLNLIDKNSYLAGGVFRHLFDKEDKIIDYDIFFKNEDGKTDIKEKLDKIGANNIFSCPNGKLFTYRYEDLKIQLITEFTYNNVFELVDSFDINACRFCYHENKFYFNKESIKDVKKKRITLHRADFPAATFNRIIKYKNKGYILPHDTLEWIVNDIWSKGVSGILLDTSVYID